MKNRTYRYFQGDVFYPFGYGLSYSRFNYGAPEVKAKEVKAGASVVVTAMVHNTSSRAGDEVAELYVNASANGSVSRAWSLRDSRESICGRAKRGERSLRFLPGN